MSFMRIFDFHWSGNIDSFYSILLLESLAPFYSRIKRMIWQGVHPNVKSKSYENFMKTHPNESNYKSQENRSHVFLE